MAKDPRGNSAYDSGLRGREKPKASGDGSSKQKAGSKIGNPDGETNSAFSTGMRGSQKPPSSATQAPSPNGGENANGPGAVIGHPGGLDTAGEGKRAGVTPGQMNSAAADAHGMDENSLERSASGMEPYCDEDDTHINIRVPKSSIHRKQGGNNKA